MALNPLLELFRASVVAWGLPSAGIRLLRASRGLLHPARLTELLELDIVKRLLVEARGPEAFSFLTSAHYLSRDLTLGQRIDSALHHYRLEQTLFSTAYIESVYRAGGLELWSHQTADRVSQKPASFSVRLMLGNDNLFEGCLSATCFVDAQRVCVMSFSYVDADLFGRPGGTMLFVTRKQSGRHPEQQLAFARAFKHSSPPYFCMAAIAGVAIALGTSEIAAIRHRAHPTYDRNNAAVLHKSYDEFWAVFGAREMDGQSFRIPVPLEMRDVAQVSAGHRNRARKRRQFWAAVEQSAAEAIRGHLVSPAAINRPGGAEIR